MSTNPNLAGSESYRTTRTDLVTFTSGYDGALKDYIAAQQLSGPATTGVSAPTLVSVHFGSGDTGSGSRTAAYATGEFTLVYGNCSASTQVSVELLHVGA
jgi:hypothetical protein